MPTPMQAAIMSSGSAAAYVDMWFAANTYRVAGVTTGDLPLVSGFTFTGASLRTMFDSTGAMTYGPNNLILYSQEFDNAAWVKTNGGVGSVPVVTPNTALAPDGTMTADTVVFTLNGGTASGDISQLQQATPFSVQGISSFWAMTTDGSSKVFTFVGPGGSSATITITGTYQRFFVKDAAAGASTMRLRLRGSASGEGTAASASIYLWGAQLEAVTYQTTPAAYMPTTSAAYYGPRLVYDPVTLASLGILVEEARTNLCLQSQTFGTTWATSNSTVSSNAATAPDGTTTADKLIPNAAASNGQVYQAVTISNATAYNISLFVKAAGMTSLGVTTNLTGTYRSNTFNLTLGTVTATGTGFTNTIADVGNGWWRVTLQATSGTTGLDLQIIGNATGDGTIGLYLWQAQLEAGTGASSAIVTTSAAVTRAADVVSLTGLDALFNATAVTAIVEGATWDTVNYPAFFAVGRADSSANYIAAFDVASSSNLGFEVYVAGVAQAVLAVAGNAKPAINKLAGTYAANNFSLLANGGSPQTDTSGSLPTVDILTIGRLNGNNNYRNGTIGRLRFYLTTLPVQQLQALTA